MIPWSTAKEPYAAEGFSRSCQRADVRYTRAPKFGPMMLGHRLRGGTPWRYDGKASCMSKLLPGYTGFGDQLKDDEHPYKKYKIELSLYT